MAVTTGSMALRARVAEHDLPLADAFHAREGDEILLHDIQHIATHQQQRQALQIKRQRNDRQDQVAPVIGADQLLPKTIDRSRQGWWRPRPAATAA